jgi:hypothetical protein
MSCPTDENNSNVAAVQTARADSVYHATGRQRGDGGLPFGKTSSR